ncbi:MAG: DUF3048 domain-containing protein [Patescibacteria group bacterium]|nr:DUF3048 domain-containing protein [Patescibacteria group bacterium]
MKKRKKQQTKNKLFDKEFLIIVWIIICFFIAAFSFVWIMVRIEILNTQPSGVIVEFEDGEGGRVLSSDEIKSPLIAVIIDNYIHSRPVIGLSKALFVWEAPVEAGITRFMAIYPLNKNEEIEKIGPVRSLRPYFIDWAAELGAIIIHCGGSPDALDKIQTDYTRHIDQFYNFNYFWRTWKRYAPHNVLTSTENLREAVDDMDYKTSDFDSWKFKEGADILERPKSQEILVDFWLPEHKIKWKYNLRRNDYERMQGGEVHKDEDGNEIRAKNIVIQFTDVEIIDAVGRREIRTMGEGIAGVFMDGKRINGSWKKPSQEARTRFYNEDGDEIFFNSGTTWIEVVPTDIHIEVDSLN